MHEMGSTDGAMDLAALSNPELFSCRAGWQRQLLFRQRGLSFAQPVANSRGQLFLPRARTIQVALLQRRWLLLALALVAVGWLRFETGLMLGGMVLVLGLVDLAAFPL